MRTFTSSVVLCSLLQFAPTARSAPADTRQSSLPATTAKKPPRSARPPCDVSPTLHFLENDTPNASQEEQTSAAWFARAVQLDNAQRQIAWKSLSTAPQSVHDLYAGPFGLHATVLEFERAVLVMYRGTQDPLDYILNAVIYTSPGWIHGLPGWIHTGFLTNFGLSWRQLRPLLRRLTSQGKPVVFASHSLGGAMSHFAAWRLEDEGIRVSKIFAFQTPTGGDVHFKHAFDERFSGRTFNTLYGDDITPFIPPSRSSLRSFTNATVKPLSGLLGLIARQANYGALGGRFEIQSDGELKESQEQSEDNFWKDYKIKSGGKGFPLGLNGTSKFVSDHNIDFVLCHLVKRP